MDPSRLLKKNIRLERENRSLRTENIKLEKKVRELEDTIEELLVHNKQLGESVLTFIDKDNIVERSDISDHPLAQSVIFDEDCEFMGSFEKINYSDVVDEIEEQNQSVSVEQNRPNKLKRLAKKYSRVIYAINKINTACATYTNIIRIGKALAILL